VRGENPVIKLKTATTLDMYLNNQLANKLSGMKVISCKVAFSATSATSASPREYDFGFSSE
jgi:hypothetical protein